MRFSVTTSPLAGKPEQPPASLPLRTLAARVFTKLEEDNAGLLAGGIAMYGLLSVFPGLAAAVSIYGLFETPADVIQHMHVFAGVLPPGVWSIFADQLRNVVAHDHGTLTIAALIGLLVALWSARFTVSALMTATNIAYRARERRGYIHQVAVSLLLTLAVIVGFVVMLLVGVVIPLALEVLGTGGWAKATLTVLRWLVLWLFAVTGVAIVYRYAPARHEAHWRWLTFGSGVAASLWLVLSGLLTLYVRAFAGYDRTYGPLSGVIVLLMWFYLLSFALLLGAEIDAVRSGSGARPARLHAVAGSYAGGKPPSPPAR
jgi:membrane protein